MARPFMPFRITVDKQYNHELWNIKSEKDIAEFFEEKKLSNPLWLLTDTEFHFIFGVNYNYEILDEYIDTGFDTEYDTIFGDGIRLRKLKIKENDTLEMNSTINTYPQ